MKWQVNEMAVDKMAADRQNGKFVKWQVDKMANG